MKKFNITITTKNGKSYHINDIEDLDFRSFANKISLEGFVIFNDIMINALEIVVIEVRP